MATVKYCQKAGLIDMATLKSVIQTQSSVLSGTPVFAGTRVPFQNLIDYLEQGDSINTFLQDFPSVSREQVVAALDLARDALIANARTNR